MDGDVASEQLAVLTLGPELSGVVAARRFVLDRLAEWSVNGEVRQDAALVASELVTNALRHGPPPVTLLVALLPDRVRIAVADSSLVPPQPVVATLEEESGRGLALLDALGAVWGSEQEPPGKRVWCDLPRTS